MHPSDEVVDVCVVGAGPAGREAAREAALLGAKVTLVDALEERLPDWGSWPDLIRPPRVSDRTVEEPPLPPEVTILPGTRVASISTDGAVLAGGQRVGTETLVLAT